MTKDSLSLNESNVLENPFIELKEKYIKYPSDVWKYVDDWTPGDKDIIFGNIVGAIIAPVCEFYKFKDKEKFKALDYFATSTKKCYNSDTMRFHTCHYLNYFEKFYDKDKEYLAILCTLKYRIDNNGIIPDPNDPTKAIQLPMDLDSFMNQLRVYILSPNLIFKTSQMANENYSLDLNYKNSNNPSLQYNDNHACLLMQCSILMNMMIPLLTHYFYIYKITMRIDDFLLNAFDMIFNLFPDIDLYNKLYETSSTNIGKNVQANAIIWNKQDIRGRNDTTHAISSVNNIILNIMPKYIFKANIISMNYSSIMKNTGFQITDIGFEYSFIPLSSSKRDDDDISEFD